MHLSGTIRTGRANFHNGQVSACRSRYLASHSHTYNTVLYQLYHILMHV